MQIGANVVIRNAENCVLLTLREDFEVWCLPGGAVDEGESIAQAAIREAREEVGLEIEIETLVCTYAYVTSVGDVIHVFSFCARPLTHEVKRQEAEVLDARWFPLDALPAAMVVGHRARILEAAAGISGRMVFETRHNRLPHPMPRSQLYAFRDSTGMTRTQFYQHYFPEPSPQDTHVEVQGVMTNT